MRLTLILFICFNCNLFNQGVLIGNGNSPAPSAILDLSTNQKGVLIPRLTNTEKFAIQNPDTGLAIYNLDSQRFECYAGGTWIPCNSFPSLGPGLALQNDTLTLSGHYIGEIFGGGIIFHIYKGANGIEHGLILSLQNLGWQPWGLNQVDVSNSESSWDGLSNTQSILLTPGSQNSVAAICAAYNGGGFTDWYLPSVHELSLVWNNLFAINSNLQQIQSAQLVQETWYWSSTEVSQSVVWAFSFYYGYAFNQGYLKTDSRAVRAIRRF